MKKTLLEIRPVENGRAHVLYLDGKDVSSAVQELTLTVRGGGDVQAVVKLAKVAPYLAAPSRVLLDPDTAALLRSMGWTPPVPSADQIGDENGGGDGL